MFCNKILIQFFNCLPYKNILKRKLTQTYCCSRQHQQIEPPGHISWTFFLFWAKILTEWARNCHLIGIRRADKGIIYQFDDVHVWLKIIPFHDTIIWSSPTEIYKCLHYHYWINHGSRKNTSSCILWTYARDGSNFLLQGVEFFKSPFFNTPERIWDIIFNFGMCKCGVPANVSPDIFFTKKGVRLWQFSRLAWSILLENVRRAVLDYISDMETNPGCWEPYKNMALRIAAILWGHSHFSHCSCL